MMAHGAMMRMIVRDNYHSSQMDYRYMQEILYLIQTLYGGIKIIVKLHQKHYNFISSQTIISS